MRLILTLLAGSLAATGHAQPFSNLSRDDMFELSLEELMNIDVVTATGAAQAGDEAPAIVTVLKASQLQHMGINSVGEALNQVPGFYCPFDYYTYNCSVRGNSGGFRGQSKIIKVLINGQTTSFRSDTNNYLGPELIPITAIEQIEVVRGPASALYGANAFLGVVNIITKQAETDSSHQVRVATSYLEEGPSGQASYTHLGQSNHTRYHVSVSKSYNDYSGLTVPNSIPDLSTLTPGTKSKGDTASNQNLYLSIDQDLKNVIQKDISIKVDAYLTQFYGHAQWQDYGAITTENKTLGFDQKLALENQFVRLQAEYQYSTDIKFDLSLAHSKGSPTSDESLDIGADSFIPKREFGFEAKDVKLEIRWDLNKSNQLVFGVDNTENTESLFEIYHIDKETNASSLASDTGGNKIFSETGLYVQYTNKINNDYQLTANIRGDEHNIYGSNLSYRTGFFARLNETVTSKLLAGKSFKAPGATQLYAQPLFSGEVDGNKNLKAEIAQTIEAQIIWRPNKKIRTGLTLYQTDVDDQILVEGTQAQNTGTKSSQGLEAELQFVSQNYTLNGNISWQETEASTQDFIGTSSMTEGELYPVLLANSTLSYKLSESNNIDIQWQYVSERRASNSNIQLNGSNAYQLDPYQLFHVTAERKITSKINAFVKINNLFDQGYEFAGFNGVDIPGLPRQWQIGMEAKF